MAKKAASNKNKKNSGRPAAPAARSSNIIASTPVRNSPIPKASAARKEVTQEHIAKRAYEIHLSGTGGSQDDNWHRAERELRGL